MTPDPQSLLERLERLERRVLSLEGKLYHKGGLGRAVRDVVSKWPGPFTSNQIAEAVYELQPELKPVTEQNQVGVVIGRMEKAGLVIRTHAGAGPSPNIFERAVSPPAQAGNIGPRFGRKDAGESGFRGIVRSALDELPNPFTLEDLRKWVLEKVPGATIPEGSWSSTLYKMEQQNELVCVRKGHRGKNQPKKAWSLGPRRLMPTGDELRELERAWAEFRKDIQMPPDIEMLTPLQRADEL